MLEKAFLKVDMITLTKLPTSKRGGCGQLNNGGSPSVRESGRRVTALAARLDGRVATSSVSTAAA